MNKTSKPKPKPGGWETLKSGALRNGNWFASAYESGWYFVSMEHKTLGPFKTFEDGVKEWSKNGH